MRDRLIELLKKYPSMSKNIVDRSKQIFMDIIAEDLADYLLANGVIVPPCKVGETVWFIRNCKLIETKVDKIVFKHGGVYIKLHCNSMYETSCNSIGKTVFLGKEEAEEALKGKEDEEE